MQNHIQFYSEKIKKLGFRDKNIKMLMEESPDVYRFLLTGIELTDKQLSIFLRYLKSKPIEFQEVFKKWVQ